MNKLFHIFGALAVAAVIVLSGCTDAMVGSQGEEATEYRAAETTDVAALQHADPFDARAGTEVQGRIGHRFFAVFPPPDTSQGGLVPIGRIGERFIVPPPPGSGGFTNGGGTNGSGTTTGGGTTGGSTGRTGGSGS